jgi:menaquinol-cytochrome c reductase iron-sulfur subunit
VAAVAGGLAVLGPVAAGLVTFFSPLFRRLQSPQVRVALLSQVPDDGRPRAFPVLADRRDAWNHYAAKKIGSVYLIRQPGEQLPVAFTAKCPHAGCALAYSEADQKFTCPCHTSRFNLDGSRTRGDQEVAPRDMDTLPVTLRPLDIPDAPRVTEVLVTFVDFQTGRQEKIPST